MLLLLVMMYNVRVMILMLSVRHVGWKATLEPNANVHCTHSAGEKSRHVVICHAKARASAAVQNLRRLQAGVVGPPHPE